MCYCICTLSSVLCCLNTPFEHDHWTCKWLFVVNLKRVVQSLRNENLPGLVTFCLCWGRKLCSHQSLPFWTKWMKLKSIFKVKNIQLTLWHAPKYAKSNLWFHVKFKLNEILIENENFCVGPLWKRVAWERRSFFQPEKNVVVWEKSEKQHLRTGWAYICVSSTLQFSNNLRASESAVWN